MVKVTLPEQQQPKKPSYPYFAKGNVSGCIYYVLSEGNGIFMGGTKHAISHNNRIVTLIEKHLTPISGPITFENVFE